MIKYSRKVHPGEVMGPMLLLVLGILSAVGLGLYQFGEQHRFDMVSDAKNGGIFIIDRKSAAINYCTNKTCLLVGNGALPSQIMNNPAALASMQGAIMGSPAATTPAQPGQVPNGMQQNLAASGSANPTSTDVAATSSDEEAQNADASEAEGDHAEATDANASGTEGEGAESPEGFTFNN